MEPNKIIRSKRRTLAIEISPRAELIVRAPNRLPENQIVKFIEQRSAWIEKHIQEAIKNVNRAKPEELNQDILVLKRQTRQVVKIKVEQFSKIMGLKYQDIKISKAKSKWGSCSPTNNLSFSRVLAALPETVLDYVVIHELAHIKHKNHMQQFWNLVQEYCPDYKNQRRWLREHAYLLELS